MKAKEIREDCLANMTSMALESVFSAPEKLQFIQRAKERGSFVRLFFICTNVPSINAQRFVLRVMEGRHDVPVSKIISGYYRSIAKSDEILQWVDHAYFYDNSETAMDLRLVLRAAG